MTEGPRILLVSDDDDVAETLAKILRRAGYRVGVSGGREAALDLEGPPPDLLILDRDLPSELYRNTIGLLESRQGRASFPLVILGGGDSPPVPRGWHEDAWRSLPRPPQSGEALATVAALLRLGFYRPYRDLVHDLAGPVTSIHALARSLAGMPPAGQEIRRDLDLLVRQADRLMALLEEFQRARAGLPDPAGGRQGS